MTISRQNIEDALSAKKKLSDSTLRTYTSLLFSLYKKLDGQNAIEFYVKNKDGIMSHIINDMESPQSRKTLLSALYILTNDEDYRNIMMENIKIVNETYAKKKRDEKSKEKEKPFQEIKSICDDLIQRYQQNKSIYNLMNVLIGVLCSGYYDTNPPRRLMDWTEMKIANYTNEDNYLKGNYFYFNKYKTVKLYGTQKVEINKELMPLINKLKKEKLSDYLLLNVNGGKFTSSSLNKRLQILFGMGVDMLRSIYLTDHVYSNDLLKKLEDNAEKMGHSIGSQMSYYVKDD